MEKWGHVMGEFITKIEIATIDLAGEVKKITKDENDIDAMRKKESFKRIIVDGNTVLAHARLNYEEAKKAYTFFVNEERYDWH